MKPSGARDHLCLYLESCRHLAALTLILAEVSIIVVAIIAHFLPLPFSLFAATAPGAALIAIRAILFTQPPQRPQSSFGTAFAVF